MLHTGQSSSSNLLIYNSEFHSKMLKNPAKGIMLIYDRDSLRDDSDYRADTRAADFIPGTGDERYGQPSWTVRPQEQRYLPVNVR